MRYELLDTPENKKGLVFIESKSTGDVLTWSAKDTADAIKFCTEHRKIKLFEVETLGKLMETLAQRPQVIQVDVFTLNDFQSYPLDYFNLPLINQAIALAWVKG